MTTPKGPDPLNGSSTKAASAPGARDAAVLPATGSFGEGAPEAAGLYRLLVENVVDYAIFALDPSGYIRTWNSGAQRIKGYSAEEIIGRHFSIFYPEADRAAHKPEKQLVVASSEGRVEDESWRVRKDGALFWANAVITALRNADGELVGFAKVTRDLTERRRADEALRESEERFRLLVTSVRDYAIFMLDPAGRVATWNDGAQRIKGYSAQDIIGKHFSAFYPPEKQAERFPEYELEVAARDGRFEDEGWRIRKDGSRFWANVVITRLVDAHGKLVGFAKVTRDLTERRAAEERAIEDARRLAEIEAANRAKSEFLAAMSHELRTPLNAIGGYAQLMESGVGGEPTGQQLEYLSRIRLAQQHLLRIINDLLNYSRIEAGHLTYDMGAVSLGETVSRVLALVQPQAETRGTKLVEVPCDPDLIAWADESKLDQVLLNLVSNAVKFTPAGGRVVVSCTRQGDRVHVEVCDNGPGIPEEMREAVFDPFVQVGRTLTSTPEGAGLGLAISRDLARAMGGDVTLADAPGGGAVFTIVLGVPGALPSQSNPAST